MAKDKSPVASLLLPIVTEEDPEDKLPGPIAVANRFEATELVPITLDCWPEALLK